MTSVIHPVISPVDNHILISNPTDLSGGCVLSLHAPYIDIPAGKWHDASPQGNSCSIIGATRPDDMKGLSFDGIDDYVNCGSDESLDLTEALTFIAWVKGNNKVVFNKYSTSGCNGGYMTTFWGNGQGQICIRGEVHTAAPDILADDGDWHHIAMTYTGEKLQVYLDGAENGYDDTMSGNITLGFVSLYIGSKNGTQHYYTGSIDEVRIYNRSLSAAEVLKSYNQSKRFYQ